MLQVQREAGGVVANVRIEGTAGRERIWVDGVERRDVIAARIDLAVNEIPTVTLRLLAQEIEFVGEGVQLVQEGEVSG